MRGTKGLICLMLLVGCCLAALPAFSGEGRTPIWEPTTITAPGRYVVTRDILAPIPVITIAASSVDIDLNGFKLESPGAPNVIFSSGNSDISIRNGSVRGGADNILIEGADNVVIEDVHVLGPGGTGILLTGVTNFALRRNQISDHTGVGIAIDPFGGPSAETSGTIDDNQIRRCGEGILIESGSAITILGNRVEETGSGFGIRVGTSFGILIKENTVQDTADQGIWVEGSFGCKLQNNVVIRAGFIGIELAGTMDSLLLDNVVSQSGADGMVIAGEGNHIERNVLNLNGAGGIGFGLLLLGGGVQSNVYRGNSASGNVGPAPACIFPVSPDFCDVTGGANISALAAIGGDNIMPFPL